MAVVGEKRWPLTSPAPPSANDCRLRSRDGVSRQVQWASQARSDRGRLGQGAREIDVTLGCGSPSGSVRPATAS